MHHFIFYPDWRTKFRLRGDRVLYSQSIFVHGRSSPNTILRRDEIYKKRHITSGQNIMTGIKFIWEAIFRQGAICRLCPDAIFCLEEICSMDDIGMTVPYEKPTLSL